MRISTSMSRTIGIVLLASLAGLWSGRALADRRLGVGLCLPEMRFAGAQARHRAARRMARLLSRALRRPVEGFAYLKPEDLRRDIRAGALHFAVVGALFAATVPEDQILAQGRLETSGAGVWSILCRSKRELKELKGKRLQIPGMGSGTLAFIQDGVLGGKVDLRAYFRVQWAPDLLSAEKAVLLDHADAVVAPLTAPGLVPVVRGYFVPPPAFVLVDRQVPAEMVEKTRKALLASRVGIGAVRGWQRPEADAYRKLAPFSGRQDISMVLAPVTGLPLNVGDLVKDEVLRPAMPELDEPFEVR
jgi:hypothetical protein